MSKSFTWTEEAETALRKLYAEGCSSSQIAEQIGCPSRNAVIGKVHRLGILRPVKVAKPAPVKAVPSPKKSKALPPDGPVHREERRERFQAVADKALDKLNAMFAGRVDGVSYRYRDMLRECAMILPDSEGGSIDERKVCGQAVQAGTSWCPACLKIVAAPSSFAAFKHRSMVKGIAA